MSEPVRRAIAGMTFADGKLEEVLKLADAVEKSVNVPNQVATVEATGSGATQEGETTPVSAVGRGRGTRGRGQRGGYRGRGRGRGQGQQKARESVPEGSCPQHKHYGREAYYCMNVSSCPMKDIIKNRSEKVTKSVHPQ